MSISDSHKAQATPPRVLVVDDERSIRFIVRQILETQGITVEEVVDGASALEIVSRQRFDLIVLDIQLPGVSGTEVLRQLRAQPPWPYLKIVIISGLGDRNELAEFLELGADDVMSKPVGIKELPARIWACLRRAWAEEKKDLTIRSMQAAAFNLQSSPLSAASPTGGEPKQIPVAPKNSAAPHASYMVPGRITDRLNLALANIVGGFCHDLTNHFQGTNHLIGQVPFRADLAHKSLSQAITHVEELHRFVSQYYRPNSSSTVLYTTKTLSNALNEMLPGGRKILAKCVLVAIPEVFVFPGMLFHALIRPLVHNVQETVDSVDAETINVALSLEYDSLEKMLLFRFEDDGPGWPQNPELIFASILENKNFSTKGSSRGRGLGHLYRLVVQLGGQIELYRGGRGGAGVRIAFPWSSGDESR